MTTVPSLSPSQTIDTHDGTVFGDEHLLRLRETLELVGHRSRVHVVGRRGSLNRFFVALAGIARVLPSSHRRSLSGCLGGKPPFPAELVTSGLQPLKLVSEALLHVALDPRLGMQRSGRIEGAQIELSLYLAFSCAASCHAARLCSRFAVKQSIFEEQDSIDECICADRVTANILDIHDGLYRVHNSMLHYLRAVAYNQYYSIVHTRRRVLGTRHTVYNSMFGYLPAAVYKLYNRAIRTRWCVPSVQCIRLTRSTFVHGVKHSITACTRLTVHSLNN